MYNVTQPTAANTESRTPSLEYIRLRISHYGKKNFASYAIALFCSKFDVNVENKEINQLRKEKKSSRRYTDLFKWFDRTQDL